ncbi:hypothetical protein DPX16_12786 [Anabarilius grahami]|uniref:Uncharacterized protein n=1 Tax=Anabarilius grahami TaxID=495550 RepID=A0A3N0Z909_ANAGA|nr:hypothetical protein DPX16_12786 [Anabarilius grahami]
MLYKNTAKTEHGKRKWAAYTKPAKVQKLLWARTGWPTLGHHGLNVGSSLVWAAHSEPKAVGLAWASPHWACLGLAWAGPSALGLFRHAPSGAQYRAHQCRSLPRQHCRSPARIFFSPEPTADPAARKAKSEQVHESAPISFTELTHEATVVPEPKPVNKSDQLHHHYGSSGLPHPSDSALVSRHSAYTLQTSGPSALPHPSTPPAQSGSSFPLTPPQSSFAPALPQSSGTLAPPRTLVTVAPSWPSGPSVLPSLHLY